MTKMTKDKAITDVYHQIQDVLTHARSQVYHAVNIAMVQAYWNIGRIIVEEEQGGEERAEYGKSLIQELSMRISSEFGRGFDKSNLWNMRAFFLAFPILDAVRRELSWTHYRYSQVLCSHRSESRHIDPSGFGTNANVCQLLYL